MKKLLTIFALLVAFVTQGYATENIVWTGSEAISWNTDVAPGTQYETPDGTFTGLKKGDTIRVYTTTTYDEPQYVMTYKKGDGWDWTDLTTSFSEGVLSYTVDDETTAKEIAERGLIFRGQAYTITKITVETPSSSYEGTVIYNGGEVVMGTDWDKYIQLSADKFTDLNPGAVIRIYIKDVLDDVQAVFQNGSWQDIEGVDAVYPSATDTYYELTLTSSVLDVVKESGLIIKGKNFTATAVSIVSTGTAVTKYTLTITQPETGGKIKNGDADAATAEYEAGTVVTLTATPDDGYEFEKWSDGTNDLTAESDGSLKVTMDGDKAVTASFRSITVVTPAFTDGAADLSKFEVQDAEKVTYDAETHKITVTEGWTGVQITATSADDVQGKELRITFSEAAKVKATVKYADDTATDSIMSEASTILYMEIDGTKKVSQIQIQPTEAGSVTLSEVVVNAESTKPAEPEPEPETPVFTDGAADLSKFEVQDAEKVTYDATTHTITVTEGWTGIQITATSADDVQGKELRITFSEAAKVKATVKYADDTATDSIMSEAAAILYMEIDGTKKVSQIQIQPTEAGSVTLSEVIVNAESTKPAEPEPETPVFTDGAADLSKFEVQDAEKVTYDAETHKITVTEGWTGVQITATSADDVQGKELRITFSEDAKVKASVKYADDSATDSIMSEAAAILYMEIDGTKKVSQIQIQPTEAGSVTLSEVVVNAESTKPAEPEPETPVFTDGAADLSKFEVQDAEKVTYDAETHKITVTEGWTGVQITATSADDVQGKELRITFSEAAKVKATVKYADDTATDSIMSEAAAILYMEIDGTKKVSQIQIQPTEAGSVTLSEVIVNAESTKPADPEPETPVFTDGAADLSKFEVQDAEKVTYDAETHKITVTEGWTGVQITATSADDVQGKELRITFSEAAKVKASVKYADDSATDSIMSEATTILYMEIDGTKKISQIQIQPTEAGSVILSEVIVNAESTKPAEPEPEPTQTGVNITLDDLNEGWNSTYDATTKTISITDDWGARGWYIGDDRYNDKGSITVKYNAVDFPVTLKMEYKNTSDESKDTSTGASAGETEVTLDIPENVKTIEKVYITYEKAADLVLTAATVNDKVVDNRTEKTLVEKSQAIAEGDITINRGLFSNAVAGDILRIYATGLGDGSKIALEPADYSGALDGANWTSFTESPFSLKLTATLLETLKAKNLLVRGESYTFTKAALYTENELGEAISDGGDEEEDDISNENASENTKKLYSVLKDLYGKKIVSGVVANVDWNTKEAENVYGWTGKWPAMNVYDFINIHASKDVNAEGWVDYSDISSAKAWWKKGGIVGAMWHWQIKANNGTDYTCTPGTAAGETSFDASRILVDGTSENTLAKKQLDQVCGYLAKMQDAGIPVVWRPLHEASGNVEQYTGGTAWFWWGAKGADTYKKLWQWMYNYMVKTKGLNNLIWVWTSQTNDEDWYPGDAYVDIIGRDNYGATAAKLATEYEKLKESYPNKMITLAECGNSDDAEMAAISDIWDAGSRWSWFMTWYDGDYNDGKTTTHKHTSKAWWTNAVGKDYVVTRDQMKELLGQDDSGDEITGVNITLDDLNEGWSSTYDATTKTITTTGEWAARGWYIGDDRYNSKGSITVKYKAVDFGVTLKMEYTNTSGESKSVSTGAAAGETEVVLDIPTDVKTIEKVYITYQPVGKLVLTAVTVNNKVVDNRTEKTLVEKSQAIADGDIKINRGLFSNAVAGDAIRIYATGLSDASKIALEPADYSGALDGANWTAFTESPFVLKLTATTLATIQGKGLLVRGEKFTFTKAVLYTEKNLGAEIADDNGNDNNDDNGDDSGDDKGDDKEDNIFDSETGETDLSEMKGQDSATTVTANDDGSITITTTEPYKAAQIWFNTPEKVTGNVLKVEIAETGINVTVTVRYTDGSESSMATSANAASRRAGANTRSESKGTQINVPLETGKDVQSIEVKNAEAGTITIKKMSMTSMNIFANGKADLTMLKSQSNATYDTSTYTLATTKGWTGVTLTPLSTESVSGKELLVRFTNTTKVKLAVAYRDATETDMIMSEAGTAARLSLDNTKVINQITIQPTEASIITFTEIAVNAQATTDPVVPIFVDGKADLSKFSVQDASKCFYDSESYTIRVVEGWTGVQLLLGTGQQVSGEELTIRFDGNARVKASVSYTDDENVSVIMEDADNLVRLELDKSKLINKIEIQPTEAGSVKLKEVSISDQRDTSGLMMEGKMLELWTSEDGEVLSWNEVARQTKKVGSQLQEFDEILITVQSVTEGSEWPKVFLRDAYSNQVGNVVELHDVTEYPHIARIVLNSSMAEQMKQGFSICGDGITVTRLQAYRPYAPKEGDIHLSALDYGYNSSYDNVSYTVTTTSRWAARGWKIGDMRYNSKDVVIVKFQPADFPVTLKMEYIDADGYSQATSVGVAAGCAEVSMPIPADIQRLDYVYLIFQEPGSLVLTDALVVTNAEAETRGIDIPNSDTTGINGIEVNGTDDGWYNLHGVRVEKPGKGVYIRNGKKIVIR